MPATMRAPVTPALVGVSARPSWSPSRPNALIWSERHLRLVSVSSSLATIRAEFTRACKEYRNQILH